MNTARAKARLLRIQRTLPGFTLIESLVLLFIFAIIALTFFQVYAVGTRLIVESKNRLGATALANQKMEIIRSIDYDNIGTTTGIPVGQLAEDEDVSVNTTSYHVHTLVQYVDDSFDGTQGGSPSDSVPTDYKRVRLTVSWGNQGEDQQVVLFGNFSPNGIEAASSGGTLSINVLDSTGAGVSGASVHIVNSSAGVSVTATTDSTGNVLFPGAPAGTQNYQISVSKSGYYSVATLSPYPTTTYYPNDVHASVVANTLNQFSIVMDQSADLSFKTVDPTGAALPNIAFTVSGGRILGTSASDGSAVYSFNQSGTTDSNGEKKYSGESTGQYTFDLGTGVTDYELYKLVPGETTSNVTDVAPGNTGTINVVLLAKNAPGVKITVTDSNGVPLSGASVELENTLLSYDATQNTDEYGQVYFPEDTTPLGAGDYTFHVSLSGYKTHDDTVTVGSSLAKKAVTLETN